MVEIKRLDGTRVCQFELAEGSLVHRELMGDHYAKLPFVTSEPVYIHIGDWVNLTGFGRFELTEPYAPKYNLETGGYEYDLQLDAHYIKWKSKICRYVPTSNASETSFHLTATVSVHLNVIVRTINAIGAKDANFRYEGSEISFVLRNFPADKLTTAKYKQYDNTDIISALNDLAKIFDCEWWVEDNIIYFGRCELDGNAVNFELDDNVSDMSGSESKKDFATRLYAFGSTRNLPPNYRKDNSADITVNGVIQKRLMLPLTDAQGHDLCPYGYVQDDGVASETEAIESVIIDEDIYPQVECTVSEVTTYTDTATDEETGEEVTRTYYRLKDGSGFNFNTDMILEGETLHILFQSGRMNGMDFECQFNDTEKYYEVVANEDYGRFLPDTNLHPDVGDKFVIYNWDASKIGNTGLIDVAERKLYDAVLLKLADLKIDPTTYTCKMFSDWYFDNMQTSTDVFGHYNIGQKVNLINHAKFENGRSSRIIGFEIKLDIEYDEPQYIVGEATVYSKSADLQGQIDALTFNGVSYQGGGGNNGSGIYVITSTSTVPPSDSNVYSAKRSDRQFLHRDRADTAYGQIDFKQESIHEDGAQFGEHFVGGLVGTGGRVDGRGYAEFRGLRLWEWLEVPEIRFNKVSVNIGLRMLAVGGGIIETVTPDPSGAETGSCTLKLEDGDIGAIEEGDFCMGIWHDYNGNNELSNYDNRRGLFTFAGFKTVYFQVASVPALDAEGNDNSDRHYFTYLLRSQLEGGNGIHPFAAMHFSQRGNPDETDRQALYYETTQYTVWLHNVNSWEFQHANYVEIRGYLEGFSMPAVDREGNPYTKVFHGHGQVFGNAYIFGQIDQFERQAYQMLIDQSLNGSLAPNETERVTIKILDGYGNNVTSRFTQIAVTRSTGDAATDAVWNAQHTSVTNPFNISFNDLGIDGIHKLLAVFNVTATDEATDEQAQNAIDYYS